MKKLTPRALEMISERFRILSEPLRLRILHLLFDEEMTVSDLTKRSGTSQPNVSKHLRLLQGAGIVERRQAGNSVYYSIIDQSIFELCELVCGSLEASYRTRAEVFSGGKE